MPEDQIPSDSAPPTPAYAPFWPRFGAFVIDQVAIFFVFCVVSFLTILPLFLHLGTTSKRGRGFDRALDASLTLLTLAITWLWHALFESSKYQATPGKQALGLVVTGEAGTRLTFARASLRALAKIPSALFLYAGYFMMLFTPRKQALHDRLARTLVILRPAGVPSMQD